MFERLISAIRQALGAQPEQARQQDEKRCFEELNRQAPVRGAPVPDQAATSPGTEAFLCREAVLDRNQRVAGYQFMLHEGTRNRIRARGRRILHAYAEGLVRNIAQANIARLLGHRRAFLDIPDSFLEHASLLELPPTHTTFVITPLAEDGAPSRDALEAAMKRLRTGGYTLGLHAAALTGEHAALLPHADFVVLSASTAEPEHLKTLVAMLRRAGSKAKLVARDLPSQDDFQLCFALGTALFQGPFVTSRENWTGNKLGPNTARLADLIARLRRDADTRELVDLLKQDAALSLRLLRYINSAAVGLAQEITSIDKALLQLGRERLYRWLMLLLYATDNGAPRAAAALENALVRARLMELLGESEPPGIRDALYLVGLLSLVDVVLQVPMAEAIASLAPAPEIEAAVVRGEGVLADYLQLAIACETGDPAALESAAARCAVSPAAATRKHLDAFTWALELNA